MRKIKQIISGRERAIKSLVPSCVYNSRPHYSKGGEESRTAETEQQGLKWAWIYCYEKQQNVERDSLPIASDRISQHHT